MATSIFGIGVSGLNAAQSGLLVTGHNITNAATDGFHRQEAVQGTQTPQETGAGFFGKGVTRRHRAACLQPVPRQRAAAGADAGRLPRDLRRADPA